MTVAACVAVAVLTPALELAKIDWHKGELGWIILHAICAYGLGGIATSLLEVDPALTFISLLFILASQWTIDAKRKGQWHGKLLSLLSSWPVEIAALYALGWWGIAVGSFVAPITLRIWIIRRPAHWTPSFWEQHLPAWVIRLVTWRS